MQVTQEMLEAAMKKAVEVGMLPKMVDTDTYLKNWKDMRAVLQAAIDAPTGRELRLDVILEENLALVAKLRAEKAKPTPAPPATHHKPC